MEGCYMLKCTMSRSECGSNPIVTPTVLERPVVRREVRLARQEGVQVTPVVGLANIDWANVPRWLGHMHDLNFPEQWERLVAVLKGPSTQERMPFIAPDLPDGFVSRPTEYEALKGQLLDKRGDAVCCAAWSGRLRQDPTCQCALPGRGHPGCLLRRHPTGRARRAGGQPLGPCLRPNHDDHGRTRGLQHY
jgi:hypothetical protein